MSKVLFFQSKQQELETILWTIKNYSWLEKLSYETILPRLPKKLWQIITEDNDSFKNSRRVIKQYLQNTNQLNHQKNVTKIFIPQWKKIENNFFSKITELTKIKPLSKYICYLTKYGGGGSFNPPNYTWVRANMLNKNDYKYFTYAVAHEITHLLLYKKLRKNNAKDIENKIDNILIKTNLFK